MPSKPDCTSILSCYAGVAIATKIDGVPGPLSGQFSNWPFEGVFGVGDCGIETRQNVANCTIFRTYATAVGKPGQFRNFLLKGATAFFERTAKTQRTQRKTIEEYSPCFSLQHQSHRAVIIYRYLHHGSKQACFDF